MKEERKTFVLQDEKGNQVEYEEWFSFESTETGKHYIVYSDNVEDEKGNIKAYVSIYDPANDEVKVNEKITDEELKVVEDIIEQMQAMTKEGNEQE